MGLARIFSRLHLSQAWLARVHCPPPFRFPFDRMRLLWFASTGCREADVRWSGICCLEVETRSHVLLQGHPMKSRWNILGSQVIGLDLC